MSFAAVIFDMDGVLVDSERLWREADGNRIAELFPEEEVQAIRVAGVGRGMRGNYAALKAAGKLEMSFEEYAEDRKAFALQNVYPYTQLIPGVEQFLQLAAAHGPVGLGSSSPREFIDCVFARHPLESYFAATVSSDDVDGREKPLPDIYLRCAELLAVPPAECLVIEDSATGVQAGKAAGMTVWAYSYPDNAQQDFSQADAVFFDFTSLSL